MSGPAPAPHRPWERWVAEAAACRPVVLAGSGIDHLPVLARVGADAVGAVGVGMGFDRPAPAQASYRDRTIPVLGLRADVRSALDLQAGGFDDALRRGGPELTAFLDAVDPDRDAAVVSLYAAPTDVLGGRTSWAVDAALARRLEAKQVGSAPLGGVLDWIEGERAPRPADVDAAWWRAATDRLGADRLVVQALGMSCGGRSTWICDSPDAAGRAIAGCPDGARVTPYVEGTPVNVMGVVGDDVVLVLPPSVVTGTIDRRGRPGYAGNVTGRLPSGVEASIAADARRAGAWLAAEGYRGPFGLDAILDADGRRHHHDLNARVNGSARLHDVHVPLFGALLLLGGWLTAARAEQGERELWGASAAHPLARTWLRETATGSSPLRSIRAGRYRVDPDVGAEWLDDVDDPSSVDGDLVLVRTRRVEDLRVRAGDDVVHGDLFTSPWLHDEVRTRVGDGLVHRWLDLLRGAPRG